MHIKRKLIKQGKNALTITLPKEWIKSNNLKQSDEIEINIDNNAIIINTNKVFNETKTTIHLPPMSIYAYRHFLDNAYRKGFDEIKITFEKTEQFSDIASIVDELLGFEIVNQTQNSITIKSVALPDAKEYDILFKRNFHIVHTAFDYLIEDLKSGSYEDKKILTMQKNHLKVCNFCKRLIYTHPAKDKKESYIKYQLLVLNDHCISQLKYTYLSMQNLKKPTSKLINYLIELKKFFESVTNAIFKEDQNLLLPLINKKYELYEIKKQMIKNAGKNELEILQEAGILLRLITDYVSTFSLLTFKKEDI